MSFGQSLDRHCSSSNMLHLQARPAPLFAPRSTFHVPSFPPSSPPSSSPCTPLCPTDAPEATWDDAAARRRVLRLAPRPPARVRTNFPGANEG
jgi:hypothetical protein